MNVLSLFSGVGGFDLGLEAAGMHTVGLCEIDKNCRKVLRRHWPEVPIYEDVSTLTAEQLISDGVLPDLVAFGSPCQDLSVAGKRAGLAGARSGLFGEALRIIRELKEATHGTYPTWAIWENVTGALNSTSGRDFAAVLDALADAGAVAIEWAVLDAQNFGVPQRRRRVFLVACFDPRAGEFCPEPLLPVGEGSPRDLAPRRAAWKDAAREVAGRAGGGGDDGTIVLDRASFNQGANAQYVPRIEESDSVPTLVARGPHAVAYRMQAFGQYEDDGTASALKARDHKDATDLVVNEPVIMRQREGKPGGGKGPLLSDVSLTLATGNDQYLSQPTLEDATKLEPVLYEPMSMGEENWVGRDIKNTLRAGESKSAHAIVEPVGIAGDVAHSLTARMDSGEDGTGRGTPVVAQSVETYVKAKRAMSADDYDRWEQTDTAPTLNAFDMGDVRTVTAVVEPSFAVRRLTPLECERLMGWPEDHTRWSDDGAEMADSHRYKMCGNGIASPVAEWVGRHVLLAQAYLQAVQP